MDEGVSSSDASDAGTADTHVSDGALTRMQPPFPPTLPARSATVITRDLARDRRDSLCTTLAILSAGFDSNTPRATDDAGSAANG